jgi:hypothetical protein
MTKLTVRSPAELISAVPFLIGFHPADSLTVVALRGPEIVFAVRADLPERCAPPEQARAAVGHLGSVVIGQQVHAVAIIGYGDAYRVTPAVLRLSEMFRKGGIAVLDELRVQDGRYWSLRCTDLSCCPPEGRPCDPPDSLVAVEATFAGAVALPDREAFAAQVAPLTGADRDAMTAATERALRRLSALTKDCVAGPAAADGDPGVLDEARAGQRVRRAGREAVRAAEARYRAGGRCSDDEAAWLGLLLRYIPVRDYAWARTRRREWELTLWSDLVRRVEPRWVPAPASLLAFVAWRSGSGVLASIAVERALDVQEDYSLARLVRQALMLGIPPSALDGWPARGDTSEPPGDTSEPSSGGAGGAAPGSPPDPGRPRPGHPVRRAATGGALPRRATRRRI